MIGCQCSCTKCSTVLGVGRDLGSLLFCSTPAKVLRAAHAPGGLAPRGAKGSLGQAPVMAKRVPVFFMSFACGQRIEETLHNFMSYYV